MSHKLALLFFILCESLFFIIGINTNPLIMILIPMGLVVFLNMIDHPDFMLMLLSFTAVIKGVLQYYFPVFALVDITMVFTIILWCGLIKLLLKSDWHIMNDRKGPMILFILMLLFLAYSLFYTPSPVYGASKIGRFLLFGLTMFVAPLIMIKTSADSEKLLKYFQYSIYLILAVILSQFVYFIVSGKFALFLGYYNRFSIPGANPIQVSRYLAIGATIMIIYLLKNAISVNKLKIILLFVLLVGIIATGSRGALVSMGLGVLMYAYFFEKKQRKQIFIFSFIALFLSVGLLFILPEILTKRFFDVTKGAILVTPEGVKQINTVATRLTYWQMAIESWASSFWNVIMGSGAGGFSSLFIWRDWRWYPHNMFFEILVEFGLTGLLLLLGFLVMSYHKIQKWIKNSFFSDLNAIWIAVTFVIFISAQFSGDINDNRILWMLIGISMATSHVEYQHYIKTNH